MPHCASCWTEFVPGIAVCTDCGGPLDPAPLPDTRPLEVDETEPTAAYPHLDAIDSALGEYPGARAEFVAQILSLEGIHSRLECDGLKRHRGPKVQATGPIAETLPVEVFVAAADLERAREIVASSEADDVIGEQWAEGEEPIDVEPEPESVVAVPASADPEAPETERNNLPILLALGAAILVVLFMLGR